MTKKKSYDETSVLRNLARRKGISIDYSAKVIKVSTNATDVGNSTWGKIDFLTNYCSWFVCVTKNTIKKQKNIIIESELLEPNTKIAKRENKINLVKQVKSIIKNTSKRK